MLRARLNFIFLLVISLSILTIQTSYSQPTADVPFNGIFVGEPKVYDDRALQILLNGLKSRLGQLSGLDQSSLISRIGGLQGASATQSGFSLQATGTPIPAVTTTLSQANPTTQATTGGTTSTPSTVTTGSTTQTTVTPAGTTTVTSTTATTPSNTTTNQNVTTTPGSTSQTVTAAPQLTPSIPAQPTVPSYTMPSTFSPSALDTLGEQMQLSYEIINLQMLLDGALNDQYIKGTDFTKKHVTIGFPISITVPNQDYRDALAEVEITICNRPKKGTAPEPPSIMTLLPREKTYNVASLVSSSFSLGASAVISGIINVGGSFFWGHETYYVVRDQDTVAIQRPPRKGVCEQKDQEPVTFSWQFRPVLGQGVVQDGLRQTFAQISFPNPFDKDEKIDGEVHVRTTWHKYGCGHIPEEAKLSGSSENTKCYDIPKFFLAPKVSHVNAMDNQDGSMTVIVDGNFLSGTRVRIGSTYLDDSTPGFLNTLDYIKFIASSQSLAMNGAYVVNRDSLESEIVAPIDPDNPHIYDCYRIKAGEKPAVLTPFSDTLVQVRVPLQELHQFSKQKDVYPLAVIIGGKAFGLSDAPFKSVTYTPSDANIIFLAPKDLVHNQRSLTVKRLFLGKKYTTKPVDLPLQSDFAVASITILSSPADKKDENETTPPDKKAKNKATPPDKKAKNKTTPPDKKAKNKTTPPDKKAKNKATQGEDYTHFAIMGTALCGTKVVVPAGAIIEVMDGGTMGLLKLSADQLKGLKQLVLQNGTEPPVLVAVPEAKSSDNKPKLKTHKPINTGTGVKYTITGTMLESVIAINYLGKQLPFTLSLDKTSISVTLPGEMTATEGIRTLFIIYSDGSSDWYTVTVGTPKST
ncbi:MAG: hypothetical protein ABSA46_15210 [Thermodesulfovibrionales bacterium]|jgi:hypothetical protein